MESSCSCVECVIVDKGLKTPNCKKIHLLKTSTEPFEMSMGSCGYTDKY